jgi:hypothetical protein
MARRWFFALLVVSSLWIAADHFEWDQVLDGLSHGRWHWLLAALGAQASHCLARAMLYRFCGRSRRDPGDDRGGHRLFLAPPRAALL